MICKFLKDFAFLVALVVFGTYICDDSSHAIDVVGHDNATKGFDEDKTDGLKRGGGYNITEPNREHDVCSPVVRPNVLLGPRRIIDTFGNHPIGVGIETGHRG
jgi:hypothetical protein